MDAAGAQELQRRVEAHANWQEAEAVRDGRQHSVDPDAQDLVEIRDGVRFYKRDGLTKQLVDGQWERVELGEDEAKL